MELDRCCFTHIIYKIYNGCVDLGNNLDDRSSSTFAHHIVKAVQHKNSTRCACARAWFVLCGRARVDVCVCLFVRAFLCVCSCVRVSLCVRSHVCV